MTTIIRWQLIALTVLFVFQVAFIVVSELNPDYALNPGKFWNVGLTLGAFVLSILVLMFAGSNEVRRDGSEVLCAILFISASPAAAVALGNGEPFMRYPIGVLAAMVLVMALVKIHRVTRSKGMVMYLSVCYALFVSLFYGSTLGATSIAGAMTAIVSFMIPLVAFNFLMRFLRLVPAKELSLY